MTPPKELVFTDDIARGARDVRARLVQEWLGLQGHGVAIDNDYGGTTETAVEGFQVARGLAATGRVDEATVAALTAPTQAALAPLAVPAGGLEDAAVAVAGQHLAPHPREVGGGNSGPWVRFPMNGRHGKAWPWCAGFACFILRQACDTPGQFMAVSQDRFLRQVGGVRQGTPSAYHRRRVRVY